MVQWNWKVEIEREQAKQQTDREVVDRHNWMCMVWMEGLYINVNDKFCDQWGEIMDWDFLLSVPLTLGMEQVK